MFLSWDVAVWVLSTTQSVRAASNRQGPKFPLLCTMFGVTSTMYFKRFSITVYHRARIPLPVLRHV